MVQTLNTLAACYSQEGRYDQAEPLYKHVIAFLGDSTLKEQLPMVTVPENYAVLLRKTAREKEAGDMLERESAIRAKLAPTPH